MNDPIVLASASPRRKEMFAQFGISVTVRPADIDETPMPGEGPVPFAIRMAGEKGLSVATALANDGQTPFVVAADTVVILDDEILGKPTDEVDARRMLSRLNGRTHSVVTAWAVGRFEREWTVQFCETLVRFYDCTRAEMDSYVATGEPMDKAGGYGIQGLGGFLVERIEGNYANVVGLPIADVLRTLQKRGALGQVLEP